MVIGQWFKKKIDGVLGEKKGPQFCVFSSLVGPLRVPSEALSHGVETTAAVAQLLDGGCVIVTWAVMFFLLLLLFLVVVRLVSTEV